MWLKAKFDKWSETVLINLDRCERVVVDRDEEDYQVAVCFPEDRVRVYQANGAADAEAFLSWLYMTLACGEPWRDTAEFGKRKDAPNANG